MLYDSIVLHGVHDITGYIWLVFIFCVLQEAGAATLALGHTGSTALVNAGSATAAAASNQDANIGNVGLGASVATSGKTGNNTYTVQNYTPVPTPAPKAPPAPKIVIKLPTLPALPALPSFKPQKPAALGK